MGCVWVGMLSFRSLRRLTWSSDTHSGFLRFVRITRLKVNLNRLKIYFWVTGIMRKSLLTSQTKLLINLGITSGYLDLLNALFMLDFLGLYLLASWLPIRFLSLLHAVILRLWFEPSLQLERHFALLIRMSSLSFNKGGARGVMVIVVGNWHGHTSSIPGWGWLHFT